MAILADHLHLSFGAPYEHSPEQIALSYLNNVSYAHGMRPVYQFGYYVGTFGEYDMEAVRRIARDYPFNRPSTDAGSVGDARVDTRVEGPRRSS